MVRRSAIFCAAALILVLATGCDMLFKPVGSGHYSFEEPTSEQAQVIRVAASWAVLPMMNELEKAYLEQYPNVVFQVSAAESGLAKQSLEKNQADIAFVIDETAGSVFTGTIITKFNEHPPAIAYDALVVAASVNTTIDNLTTDQLRDIYAGRVLTWDRVGGDNSRAEFVSRESGSVTRLLFDHVVMRGEAISTAAVVLPNDEAVKDYIIRHPGAIGYLSMSYVDARIKIIKLDGRLPDQATVKSGAYPLARPIVGLLGTDVQPDAQRLLSLALGEQGCQIAAEQHYICLR